MVDKTVFSVFIYKNVFVNQKCKVSVAYMADLLQWDSCTLAQSLKKNVSNYGLNSTSDESSRNQTQPQSKEHCQSETRARQPRPSMTG